MMQQVELTAWYAYLPPGQQPHRVPALVLKRLLGRYAGDERGALIEMVLIYLKPLTGSKVSLSARNNPFRCL